MYFTFLYCNTGLALSQTRLTAKLKETALCAEIHLDERQGVSPNTMGN
jgi:hypothetical protein